MAILFKKWQSVVIYVAPKYGKCKALMEEMGLVQLSLTHVPRDEVETLEILEKIDCSLFSFVL
ncbi:hypothetical protein QQP08_002885 [Theobroma cacao]|nr:hypothetical protein QQP08_002885 [Theobroma cacao]